MMRPIARRLIPGSALASDPNSYPLSKSGTGAVSGIKLRTVTRTVEVNGGKSTSGDDSSSTKNLADVETGSINSSGDENNHDSSRHRHSGGGARDDFGASVSASRTVIGRASLADRAAQAQVGPKGIHVKNETSISYERI